MINRFVIGLNAADRRGPRTGEADIVIAAGNGKLQEHDPDARTAHDERRRVAGDENVGIVFGMGLTSSVAARGAVTREEQDAFALSSHRAGAPRRPTEIRRGDQPGRCHQPLNDLATDRVVERRCAIARDEGPRDDRRRTAN